MRNFFRCLAPIVSLILCSLSWAQQNDPLVTYQCSGIPAKAVCQELSRISGVKLATSGVMAPEPLIIKVVDQPLSKLLDKIARATDGTWAIEADGTRRLIAAKKGAPEPIPTAKAIARAKKIQARLREELAKETEFDQKAATALLVEIDEYLKGGFSDREYYRKGEAIGSKGPISGLAKRIAVELDPRHIAIVRRENRLVFSTHPTQSQLPLPKPCLTHLARFAKEYQVWTSAVGDRTFRYPENRGLSRSLYELLDKNLDWHEPNPDDSQILSKALVFLSAWSTEGAGQIEVKIVNGKGKYIAQSSLSLRESRAEESALEALIAAPSDPNEPDLQLDPISSEFVDRTVAIFNGRRTQGEQKPLSTELEKRLLSPETLDPISLAMPEALLQYADYKKLNVVASPPDFAVMAIAFAKSQGATKVGKTIDVLKGPQIKLTVEESDSFLVVGNRSNSPDVPQSLQTRADRKNIGITLRNLKQTGFLTIEAKAESAVRAGDDGMQGDVILMIFVGMLNPGELREFQTMGDSTWYKLYGLMNASQRHALSQGKNILFSELAPQQKRVLRSHIYGQSHSLNYNPKDPASSELHQYFYEGIKGEPTERWPDGLPAGCYLSAIEKREIVVTGQGRQSSGSESTATFDETGETMDARQFAYYLASLENPAIFGQNYQPPTYSGYKAASRRMIEMTLWLDEEVSASGSLTESQIIGSRVQSINQLPDEFLKEVMKIKAKVLEDVRKSQPPPAASAANSHLGSVARL